MIHDVCFLSPGPLYRTIYCILVDNKWVNVCLFLPWHCIDPSPICWLSFFVAGSCQGRGNDLVMGLHALSVPENRCDENTDIVKPERLFRVFRSIFWCIDRNPTEVPRFYMSEISLSEALKFFIPHSAIKSKMFSPICFLERAPVVFPLRHHLSHDQLSHAVCCFCSKHHRHSMVNFLFSSGSTSPRLTFWEIINVSCIWLFVNYVYYLSFIHPST